MKFSENLTKTHFFSGIPLKDIEKLQKCLNCEYKEYVKDETIVWEGDLVSKVGVVLSGEGRSVKTDASGKVFIETLLKQGDYISVLLAASFERKSPVSVEAVTDMSVMFFPAKKITGVCKEVCPCHIRLIDNYLDAIAEKALFLHGRVDLLIKPSVREKVMEYLSGIAGSDYNYDEWFTVPLDRNGMAEYLNVERSALSRELSRMKQDGLIDYCKDRFRLV